MRLRSPIIAVYLTKKWLWKFQLASGMTIPSTHTFGDEHAEKFWCYLQFLISDASTSRARLPPQVLVLFKLAVSSYSHVLHSILTLMDDIVCAKPLMEFTHVPCVGICFYDFILRTSPNREHKASDIVFTTVITDSNFHLA